MKNSTGVIGGFVFGVAGFLLLFKIIFLDRIPLSDELAPGIVVLASVLNGVLFGYLGYSILRNLLRRKQSHERQ